MDAWPDWPAPLLAFILGAIVGYVLRWWEA
jgi:hypothetical protein